MYYCTLEQLRVGDIGVKRTMVKHTMVGRLVVEYMVRCWL